MSENPEIDSRRALQRLRTPLGLIFWGALLVVLDFRLGLRVGKIGGGVDVLPDTLGAILYASGLIALAWKGGFSGLSDVLITISASISGCFATLYLASHFVVLPEIEPWAAVALQTLNAVAFVFFCLSMHFESERFQLLPAVHLWLGLAAWGVFLYLLPQVFLVILPTLARFQIWLMILGAIPLAIFFYTIRCMRSDAE